MRYLLPYVLDEDDSGDGQEGEAGSQLNGPCEQNEEGCDRPELAVRMERGGCLPTELAARAEYLALSTSKKDTDHIALYCGVIILGVVVGLAMQRMGAPGDPRIGQTR